MKKYFLLLFLFAFIFSYHCLTEHPYCEKVKGDVIFQSCVCIIPWFRGIYDPINNKCFCYLQSEVAACENDEKCKLNANVMCVNA